MGREGLMILNVSKNEIFLDWNVKKNNQIKSE